MTPRRYVLPVRFPRRLPAAAASERPGYGPVVGRLLVVLCCYFFLSGLMQSLVSVRGAAAGLGGVQFGLTLGLASGGLGLVLDMPIAQVADERGKRKVMAAGMAAFLAGSLLLLAGDSVMLYLGSFLAGLGAIATGGAMLSWLGSAAPYEQQARLQGINGSVQRFGALIAAGVVGLAIALRWPGAMAVAAAAVAVIGYLATAGTAMRSADAGTSGRPLALRASYPRGLRMLARRRILLAAVISLAINIIFLETNSYVPLVTGHHRAIIVSATLAARDLAAVGAGAAVAAARIDMASPSISSAALAIAGLAAWASSYLLASPVLVVLGAVQGAVVGISIAATNLFTISSTTPGERTLAMAATLLPSRLMLLGLPVACSVVLRAAGLADVFRMLSVVLVLMGAAALGLGHAIVRSAVTVARDSSDPV